MNDAFAWDIGDLAKFALLRQLSGDAADRLRLGAVWCYTRKLPRSGHGRHTAYLVHGHAYGESVRQRDGTLYNLMVRGLAAERSIMAAEYRALLPDDTAHILDAIDGPSGRSAYWEAALRKTATAAVVFFDPDNGIAGAARSLSVSYEELKPFYLRGQSLVIYQHQTREKGGIATLARDRRLGLERHLGAQDVMVLRWHRYQARLFFVVPTATYRQTVVARVHSLLALPWGMVLRRRLPDFSLELPFTPP